MADPLRLAFRRSPGWWSSGSWQIAGQFDAEHAPQMAAHAAAVCALAPGSSWRIETKGGVPVDVAAPDLGGGEVVGLRTEVERLRARLARIESAVRAE